MVRTAIPFVLAAMCLSIGNQGTTLADEPFVEKDQITNAALVYWQAFAVLPNIPDSGFQVSFNEEKTYVVPQQDLDLLDECQVALRLVEFVRVETPCRWETVADGPHTLMPHLAKSRLLARVLLTQALVDAQSDENARAVDRIMAAMILARNVDEGSLINLLVAQAIETLTVTTAESFSDDLTNASKQQLSNRYSQLPPRAKLDSTIRYEKELFFDWAAQTVLQDKDAAIASLKPLIGQELDDEMLELLEASEDTKKKAIAEFSQAFDRLRKTVEPAQVDPEALEALETEIAASNNLMIKYWMPNFSRLFRNYGENQQRLDAFWNGLAQ